MDRRITTVLVWIALAVPLLMDSVYFSLIRGQGAYPPDVFTVPFVAAYMLLMTCMLAVSLVARLHLLLRAALRGGAAGGLIVLGVLAAFSIGLPVLVAGLLAATAFGLSLDRATWLPSLAVGGAAAVALGFALLLGVDLANRTIACPPDSTESGGGNGIVLGPYRYQCMGGRVVWSTPTP